MPITVLNKKKSKTYPAIEKGMKSPQEIPSVDVHAGIIEINKKCHRVKRDPCRRDSQDTGEIWVGLQWYSKFRLMWVRCSFQGRTRINNKPLLVYSKIKIFLHHKSPVPLDTLSSSPDVFLFLRANLCQWTKQWIEWWSASAPTLPRSHDKSFAIWLPRIALSRMRVNIHPQKVKITSGFGSVHQRNLVGLLIIVIEHKEGFCKKGWPAMAQRTSFLNILFWWLDGAEEGIR